MDFVKGWTLTVCVTVVIAVIFSFLTPKGSMGKFFKIVISLFICLSFFYPLTDFKLPSYEAPDVSIAENNTDRIIEAMVCNKVKAALDRQDIVGADVDCTAYINEDNEILIEKVQVAVSSQYDLNEVEKIIYDELNIVAQVIYIGQ